MLETNGTLVAALERALPWIAYVSMDLKLPSVDGERGRARHPGGGSSSCVPGRGGDDLGQGRDRTRDTTRATSSTPAVAMVAGGHGPALATDPRPMRDLPPTVHAVRHGDGGTDTGQVLDLQARALRIHPRVRVVPQTHKAIGQL